MAKYLAAVSLFLIVLVVLGRAQSGSPGGSPSSGSAYSFNSPQPLDIINGLDALPNALQLSDGRTMWVAWQSSRTGVPDIYYKTYNGTWSATLTPPGETTTNNLSPALAQLQNGSIILFWVSNQTGHQNIYYRLYNSGAWTKPVQLISATADDYLPRAVVTRNSTLWLFWHRESFSSSCPVAGICRQIYFRTLKGNTWSTEAQFTFDSTWNTMPSAMVDKGGNLWLAYAKWSNSGSDWSIYYRILSGTQWSAEAPLTSSPTTDGHPALAQDRNGTIWLFFNREVKLTANAFEDKLYYKYSVTLGASWTGDTQLTFGGTATNTIDDREPSAVQVFDKSLWVFFSSDATGGSAFFDIYYINSLPISPVHDVAVSSITASLGVGTSWTITVKIVDLGDYSETVTVNLTLSNIANYNLLPMSGSLSVGGSTNIVFTWNSAFIPIGFYSGTATITPVPGETLGNQADDSLQVNNLLLVTLTPSAGGGSSHSFRT